MKEFFLNFLRKILPQPVKQALRFSLNLPAAAKRFFLRQPKVSRRFQRILSGKPVNILFYPDHPCRMPWDYTIIRLCRELGLNMNPSEDGVIDLCINWQDRTFGQYDDRLNRLAQKNRMLNYNCRDISKNRVDEVFNEVFGYRLMINPSDFQGPYVEKSNLNGKHDGRIILSPMIEKVEGKVYQRLIDNRDDENYVVDFRVPFFDKDIPLVFLKYKSITDRFGMSVKAGLTESGQIFSSDEVSKIILFCKRMGFDCGELDIVRDRSDQRIYIVDANNTPTIRFVGYTYQEKRKILRTLARSFDRAFLNG
ncbi:MAG: hypothetical protein AB7S78_06605 [Candidatus Omnitrophota bacterium]